MSDVKRGPGWWQASDGKWYPPQNTDEVTELLRSIARDVGTIRLILAVWAFLVVVGVLWWVAEYNSL